MFSLPEIIFVNVFQKIVQFRDSETVQITDSDSIYSIFAASCNFSKSNLDTRQYMTNISIMVIWSF